MGEEPQAKGEILLYQTEDGLAKLDVRLAGETVWLTQRQWRSYSKKTSARSTSIFRTFTPKESYLPEGTFRKFRIVQREE